MNKPDYRKIKPHEWEEIFKAALSFTVYKEYEIVVLNDKAQMKFDDLIISFFFNSEILTSSVWITLCNVKAIRKMSEYIDIGIGRKTNITPKEYLEDTEKELKKYCSLPTIFRQGFLAGAGFAVAKFLQDEPK